VTEKQIFSLIQQGLEQSDREALNLLVGEPWYNPPETLRQFYSQHILKECPSTYSTPGGLLECKHSLLAVEGAAVKHLTELNVTIGGGAKALIFGLLSLLKKQRLVLAKPFYPGHYLQARRLGFDISFVDTSQSDGVITPTAISDLTIKPEVVLISSPSNPSCVHYTKQQQEALYLWCLENDVLLIVDEVYLDLSFDSHQGSFLQCSPDLNNLVVVRSYSKSLGICGWRFGYVLASNELTAELTHWQKDAMNPPAVPVQKAVADYLRESKTTQMSEHASYQQTAEIISQALLSCGYMVGEVDSGFYLLSEFPEHLVPGHFQNSGELCLELARQMGVGLWPGEDFGFPRGFRLSYATVRPEDAKRVAESLRERLQSFCTGFPG
jgi:aspartate/methionine/tyrosine aminotransferase